MTQAFNLQDFAAPEQNSELAEDESQFEPASDTTAFDDGYKAGWGDAVAKLDTNNAQLQVALSEALQEFSFSTLEAKTLLLKELHPVLLAIFAKVLPDIVGQSGPELIVDHIKELLSEQNFISLTVTCNPAETDALDATLQKKGAQEVRVKANAMIDIGAFLVRADGVETLLDLGALSAEVVQITSELLASEQSTHEEKTSARY